MAERLTVRVSRMAPEGEAVAKAEGSNRVVFVSGGAPGDLCEVEVVAAKSNFARARLLRLLEAGPERIAPPCPLHFAPDRPGPACGGCDWQHLEYAAQLRHKSAMVRDCVERIAKIKDVAILPVLASPKEWGYRNKVMVPFGQDAGQPRCLVAGFYAAGSHNIVDFSACPVQPDLSVRVVLKVKELAAEFGWQAYDERSGRGSLRHAFVRTNGRGQALLCVVTHNPHLPRAEDFVARLRAALPELVGIHQNIQPLKTSVILGPGYLGRKAGSYMNSITIDGMGQQDDRIYHALNPDVVDYGRLNTLSLSRLRTASQWTSPEPIAKNKVSGRPCAI